MSTSISVSCDGPACTKVATIRVSPQAIAQCQHVLAGWITYSIGGIYYDFCSTTCYRSMKAKMAPQPMRIDAFAAATNEVLSGALSYTRIESETEDYEPSVNASEIRCALDHADKTFWPIGTSDA